MDEIEIHCLIGENGYVITDLHPNSLKPRRNKHEQN